MIDIAPLKPYLERLEEKLAAGDTTEHTHRSSLEILVESLADDVKAINEPKRIECGAPDLAVLRDGFMVGHIEAKDVGTALDTTGRSGQLNRHRRTVRLAHLTPDDRVSLEKPGMENAVSLLCDFLAHESEPIGTAHELTVQTCTARSSPTLISVQARSAPERRPPEKRTGRQMDRRASETGSPFRSG